MAASSASPSGPGANTSSGRPSLWTQSAQRKMARLYVYTTLPLATIVRVIHVRRPGAAPGLDSANRRLSSMLDKEPRWLRPRDESDMEHRMAELSNSQMRLAAADRSRRLDEEVSRFFPFPFDERAEASAGQMPLHPSSFDPVSHWESQQYRPAEFQSSLLSQRGAAPDPGDDAVFSSFPRQATCLSTSTDLTTGSFRQALPDYSDSYVRTVKRLIKRFTAPLASQPSLSPSPSPAPEAAPPLRPWPLDRAGPQAPAREPHRLPGDLISHDVFAQRRACHAPPEAHLHGYCPCFDRLDAYASPWTTPDGVTALGQRILERGPTRLDVSERDFAGNTVLHFVAARGPLELLHRVLQNGLCDAVMRAKNTGGQSFLHVISRREMQRLGPLHELLRLAHRRGADINAQDVYGRTVLHILRLAGHAPGSVWRIASQLETASGAHDRRDAFGLVPAAHDAAAAEPVAREPPGTASGNDAAVANEARLVMMVRLAQGNPSLEHADGGNGLHCLAAATLSHDSLAQRYPPLGPGPAARPANNRPRRRADRQLDSGSAKLALRLSLAAALLDAGVDPNHYDRRGDTPLMAFAAALPEDDDYKTGPRILGLLVDAGARLQARNRAGETALHVAVRRGRKLAVKALVRRGASVYARDARGRSVLDVADAMMRACAGGAPREYARYEACRAWLSSSDAHAVQRPTVFDEWQRSW